MQEIFWGTVLNMPAPGTVALRSTPASDEALAGIPDKYWHHFRVTFHPDLPGSQFLRNVSVFAEGCIDCGPVHVCHRERISQCTDFGVYLRGLLGDSYYHAWAITSPDRKVWKWMSSDPCTNLYVQYPDVVEMMGWDHYVWYVLHDISDPRRWHESQWYDHQGYQRLLSLCGRPVVSGDFASMLDEAAAVSPAAAAAALPAPGSAACAGSAPYGERDVWSELSPCTPP